MKIKKIKMLVRQERWQEVEFSESNGHEMPETPNDLLEMCQEIKDYPLRHVCDGDWISKVDDVLIKNIDIVEA